MNNILNYPFDSNEILKKKKSIKKDLLKEINNNNNIKKNIAILGGSTTNLIKDMMELFLLNYGIECTFYESEYNKYYEDGMFYNRDLELFKPDIIIVFTSNRNIMNYPDIKDDEKIIKEKLKSEVDRYINLWDNLSKTYHAIIIQNNFEQPFFRLLGNREVYDIHGRIHFINQLNNAFYEYVNLHNNIYINDINYLQASYGIEKFSDPYYWYMYKYFSCIEAIPYVSYNLANIIKSLLGKNKKVLNLDLDNTLWGGVIGDDGADNIEIGKETALAETFSEFQKYIKMHKDLGVLLTINSKNDELNVKAGFERPDSILKMDDFIFTKINWEPKSINLIESANSLSLLPESFVFVDDNPAEREIISQINKGVSIPVINAPEHYIQIIDKSGFFEVTCLSKDDINRNGMYKDNIKREIEVSKYENYNDYLNSLNMKAEINNFSSLYFSRITQLTNKSNQFNLTTKRYTKEEIESISQNKNYVTFYGKLYDKFGDNGVVSIAIGKIEKENLHIDLFLMSCRVLKRGMEDAMMNKLVDFCRKNNINKIYGYYYPTKKNDMVKDFYLLYGFNIIEHNQNGNITYELFIKNYIDKKTFIELV